MISVWIILSPVKTDPSFSWKDKPISHTGGADGPVDQVNFTWHRWQLWVWAGGWEEMTLSYILNMDCSSPFKRSVLVLHIVPLSVVAVTAINCECTFSTQANPHVRWWVVCSLWEHVCCVSGPWLKHCLEVRLGPASRRESSAGYKGEERARETASRDPTAAGDPGPGPGDDCEFKAAMLVHTHIKTHAQIHTNTHIHMLSLYYLELLSTGMCVTNY